MLTRAVEELLGWPLCAFVVVSFPGSSSVRGWGVFALEVVLDLPDPLVSYLALCSCTSHWVLLETVGLAGRFLLLLVVLCFVRRFGGPFAIDLAIVDG